MTDQDRGDINRIILWKNQIKEIDDFINEIGKWDARSRHILEVAYKIKVFKFNRPTKCEYVLSDVLICGIMSYLSEFKHHLQTLVDEQETWKIEMADAIINDEITKKGA